MKLGLILGISIPLGILIIVGIIIVIICCCCPHICPCFGGKTKTVIYREDKFRAEEETPIKHPTWTSHTNPNPRLDSHSNYATPVKAKKPENGLNVPPPLPQRKPEVQTFDPPRMNLSEASSIESEVSEGPSQIIHHGRPLPSYGEYSRKTSKVSQTASIHPPRVHYPTKKTSIV